MSGANGMFQLRLSGTGGQGLILAGRMLADTLVGLGMKVSQSTTYEPTSRGGVSRCDLVVAPRDVDFPLVTGLDYVLILAQQAVGISEDLLRPDSVVVTDSGTVTRPPRCGAPVHALPLIEKARELGNVRVANVIGLGALLTLAPVCAFADLERVVEAGAPPKYRRLNVEALRAGRALATPQAAPSLATSR
jgi:2-oxoglutarate ferredoxin oxidoreductase subunit gamma